VQLVRHSRAYCRDRVAKKEARDAARTYHEGTPSDPAGNEVPVVWRA